MKKAKRLFLIATSVILIVSAMPIATFASTSKPPTEEQRMNVDGIDYKMVVSGDRITVQQLDGDSVVNTATAYTNEGYVLYRDNTSKRVQTSVFYIPEDLATSNQTLAAPSALVIPAWTKDGKYVYYPTKVSVLPTVYKEHTAYYQFRNMGTENTVRQIGLEKGIALTAVITIIAAMISPLLTVGFTYAQQVAIGLATSGGAAFVGGLLTMALTPTVSVVVTNYDAMFVDAYGNGTGQIFHGAKITVNETYYHGYGDVFYEAYAPQLSQNFGLTAFLNTFRGNYISYPGVKLYTEL